MPIAIQCPNALCRSKSMVADAIAGRGVKCKKCGTPFKAVATLDGLPSDTKPRSSSSGLPFAMLPAEFGRYCVLSLLGQGGMGAVYLAEDTQLGRKVALKLPNFDVSETKRLERFVREAKASAGLLQPNICPVFDAGVIAGRPFISMAYIAGKTLDDEIDPDRPMDAKRAAEIVRKIALALQEAHENGIVHRDLKPANVMMSARGEPVVMDFGLAKNVGELDENESKLTQPGAVMGTPSYMSPEQVRGDIELLGPATDIYALGVMLFEMLTGRTPYGGPVFVVMAQILTSPVPPLREFRPDADVRLEEICQQAMAKDIAARPASMAVFAAQISEYLPPDAVPVMMFAPAANPLGNLLKQPKAEAQKAKPSRLPILVGAAVLGLILVIGTFLALRTKRGDVEGASGTTPSKTGETTLFFQTPGFAQWTHEVAAMSAQQQLEAVGKKMRELNPEFDGNLTGKNLQGKPAIEDRTVVCLGIQLDHVTDLSPVRSLPSLKTLWCEGSSRSQGQLRDLSPLKGMKLQELRCRKTPLFNLSPLRGMPLESIDFFSTDVSDLSPLAGMQLKDVNIEDTKVRDLSPLQGMPLRGLNCPNTLISDLAPLRGMKLEYFSGAGTRISNLEPLNGMPLTGLRIQDTLVSDLSPLRGMPLRIMFCGNNNVEDLSPLHQCQTLATLHLSGPRVDAEQIALLQKAIPSCKIAWGGSELANIVRNDSGETVTDAQRRSFRDWMNEVVKVSAERQLELVAHKLQELNQGFDGKLTGFDGNGTPKIESGVVTELGIRTSQVKDISPLRALLDLRSLNCDGDWASADGKLSDLSPLRGMRLKMLSFNHTQVFDLSPLKVMPLYYLSCFRSRVESLEPLSGMQLSFLALGSTNVADLTPLQGMPLSVLNFGGTLVADLSPLQGMPLVELGCASGKVSDLSPLKGMKLSLLHFKPERIVKGISTIRDMESLTKIHVIYHDKHEHLSAGDFWKKYDAGEFKL